MAKEFSELGSEAIERRYQEAKEIYAANGINTDAVLDRLKEVSLSMHCWQGDDVRGFESVGPLTGGIVATGNFPGAARSPEELRLDATMAFSMIPGRNRFNLHAIYGEFEGKKVDRDEISIDQFRNWVLWAKETGIGLDFNPTFFSHPKAAGYTLSNADEGIREFWVEHGIRSRKIAAEIAKELGDVVVNNFWIPDGSKDTPIDRWSPRRRLDHSYSEIFASIVDPRVKDAVEGKLFGIGSESYVVGSHDFLMNMAVKYNKMLCLDMGHFHPTEQVGDKLSAVLPYVPGVLMHLSRGVRWDSDHVVLYSDELRDVAHELVRGDVLDRVCLATDYFDASINRVGAWVNGQRAVHKALMYAMLEPTEKLRELESAGRGYEVQGLLEANKTLPFGDVWNYHCLKSNVPTDNGCINNIAAYQNEILSKRE